METGIRKVKH